MQHLMDQLMFDDLARLDPPVLEARLGRLIRSYVRQCSAELAESVIRHIEALYLRPEHVGDTKQACAYRRLLRHWRWLAAQHTAQEAASTTSA